MRKSYAAAIVLASCVAVALPASRVLAQTQAPTQQDIEKALRPIPKALSGGHQGITAGAVSRFPTEQTTTRAAYTTPTATGSAPQHESAAPPRAPRQASTQTAPAHGSCSLPMPVAEPGTISLPQITFEFNSMALTPQAKETLRALGAALNAGLKDYKSFVLQGHTDAVGAADYNMELSRQRAEAAKDFLVNEMKVDPARLQVVGKGFSELADPCHPRAAENRRLVVINQSQS